MGARIAERRKQLGFTQERIAELSGVSPQFFSSIETGSKNMRVENLARICRALRVSADYILFGTTNPTDLSRMQSLLLALDGEQLHCVEEIVQYLIKASASK